MPDNNTNPDTAEAKINLLFDSYADGDISADEAKQQLKELLVDAQNQAVSCFTVMEGAPHQISKIKGNHDTRAQLWLTAQYDMLKRGKAKLTALQQTRQEEE